MPDLLVGVGISSAAAQGADPVGDALTAESAGFDFISASDHPAVKQPSFEVWTMLSWIAARTSRIRVVTRVLGVPYRNPAVLAKMAATLDQLCDGRLILGLGGGSGDDEFRSYGLRVPTPGEKVDGLADALTIIRGLWMEEDFSYAGPIFHTDRANLEPKPRHRIPIWLGTFGNRALEVTGRLADGWIPSLAMAPPDRVGTMRNRVLEAARYAGRSADELTCAYNLQIRVDERFPVQEGVVSGGPEQVTERLAEFIRIGFRAMNFLPVGEDFRGQVGRLGAEVLPALRRLPIEGDHGVGRSSSKSGKDLR